MEVQIFTLHPNYPGRVRNEGKILCLVHIEVTTKQQKRVSAHANKFICTQKGLKRTATKKVFKAASAQNP